MHRLTEVPGQSRGLKADKQLLIAHGADADVQRARELLADTDAESIETHVGEPEPVA